MEIKLICDFVKDTEDLVYYFPNYEEGSLPERSFLWGILGTLKRDKWKALLKEARNRRGKKEVENKDELIEIDPQIFDKLMSAPTVSKGKILNDGFNFWCREMEGCIPAQRKS